MGYMFNYATSFTSDLSSWDVSSVTAMSNMFSNTQFLLDYPGSVATPTTEHFPYAQAFFTSTPDLNASTNVAYSYTVTRGDALPVTATTLPSWMSFANNVLSGTPIMADVGSHSVVLTSSEGPAQEFSITAIHVNSSPIFTSSIPSLNATGFVAYSYTISTNDPDGDVVTLEGTTLPGWLSLVGNVLSGTPINADVGGNPVVLTASD